MRLALEKGLWAATVREAQECVEPSRTHDVAQLLRREAGRFPDRFQSQVNALAPVSTEMAGDSGIASYGDERQELAPQELFGGGDARRALSNVEFVARIAEKLLEVAR